MNQTLVGLTSEDQQLLLNILLNQGYALELISSEISDIENGYKKVEFETYKRIVQLYDKLRIEEMLT